jgi:cobalt-zinc-cadmium efflux system outer membrane protein
MSASVIAHAMLACALAPLSFGQATGPVRITLDEAIQMALQHNHNLLAIMTTIQQAQAEEITANLRPNPSLFADWEYLPLGSPAHQNPNLYQGQSTGDYLHNNTEGDIGLSYLIERGKKRQHRLQAARDITAQTRSLVDDNGRTLTYSVATVFVNVQLAESTLELAEQDLKSFQQTVALGELRFSKGAISEDDYLKIKLQLLQFETDVQQAQLARVQGLSDLRQLLGYESVSPDYDVAGPFDYQPVKGNLEDLQLKALQNRPDYHAAQQGVTAAHSQYDLQKAIGKPDVTAQANYSHVNGINAANLYGSIPLPIFNRNQGEIARSRFAITQAQEQEKASNGQVLTDVHDAFEGLRMNDHVIQLYRSGYLEVAQKDRDISEYAYKRGAVNLLDFLDAERSYRATQLAYRQALASYLLALEQLREAVGTRALPYLVIRGPLHSNQASGSGLDRERSPICDQARRTAPDPGDRDHPCRSCVFRRGCAFRRGGGLPRRDPYRGNYLNRARSDQSHFARGRACAGGDCRSGRCFGRGNSSPLSGRRSHIPDL